MPTQFINTAVLLFNWDKPAAELRAPQWYENLFGSITNGIAAYWYAQANGKVLISATAFGWFSLKTKPYNYIGDEKAPGAAEKLEDNLTRSEFCQAAIGEAIEQMPNLADQLKNRYNHIVIITQIKNTPTDYAADGGSIYVTINGKGFPVIRGNDNEYFDFFAHEYGHSLGFQHSFGHPSYKNATWSAPGEYGHPYCIMSARAYGNQGHTFTPNPLPDNATEYDSQGPSLNSGAAYFKGWLTAHTYFPNQPQFFEIRSLGNASLDPNFRFIPKAIHINGTAGGTYTIELRDNKDRYDQGIDGRKLIINKLIGSIAETNNPGKGNAQFIGEIPLPIELGGANSYFQNHEFCLLPMGWNEGVQGITATVQLLPPNSLPWNIFSIDQSFVEEGEEVLRGGWGLNNPWGTICGIDGAQVPWQIMGKKLACTFTVASFYPFDVNIHFRVNDIDLNMPNGTVSFWTRCYYQNENQVVTTKFQIVNILYEMIIVGNQTRLILRNDPQFGRFGMKVTIQGNSDWGRSQPIDYYSEFDCEYLKILDENYIKAVDDCYNRIQQIGNRRFVKYVLKKPFPDPQPRFFLDWMNEKMTQMSVLEEHSSDASGLIRQVLMTSLMNIIENVEIEPENEWIERIEVEELETLRRNRVICMHEPMVNH